MISDGIEYFLKDSNFPIGKKKGGGLLARKKGMGNLRRVNFCVQQKREKADKAKWILDTVKNKILEMS